MDSLATHSFQTNAAGRFDRAHFIHGWSEVVQESISNVVDQSVHANFALLARELEDRALANMDDLHSDIEFAESIGLLARRRLAFNFTAIELRDVAHMTNPVIDDAASARLQCSVYAATAIVTAHDHIGDLKRIEREVEDGETIEIAVHDEIRNVAMDEHFARG